MKFDCNDLERKMLQSWYAKGKKPFALLIFFSYVFRFIIWLRRFAYHSGLFKIHRFPVPVIIVGNISVGGTGKTPCVIALIEFLRSKGFKPGIISRGYKGKVQAKPYEVQKNSTAAEVGDEPLLLKNRCDCPVMIGKKRKDAVKALLATTDCDIIISDDGLQHYALGRDIEIVMMDGFRGFGNGYCLPAGPLREPLSRLKESDFWVVTEQNLFDTTSSSRPLFSKGAVFTPFEKEGCCAKHSGGIFHMILTPMTCYRLHNPADQKPLSEFSGEIFHAVAGIGDPERFFNTLMENNLRIVPHPFSDHHVFKQQDFSGFNEEMLILTEKDAVKCKVLDLPNAWVLPVNGVIDEGFFEAFLKRCDRIGIP